MTIRFLDPPRCMSSFPPRKRTSRRWPGDEHPVEELKGVIAALHEFNPMMGHRGCRLAVTYPEIAEMQTRAVIRAPSTSRRSHPDWNMVPEIMIPWWARSKELKYVKDVVVATADELIAAAGIEPEV